MRSIALFIASAAVAFVQAASAQDVPSRVGRLAYTQGAVSVYQDPELGWDKAYVNTPVTSENSIWTDRGARAEMRVGGAAVRLDGETQLDISRLEENELDATIQRGSVNVRVRYKQRNDHVTFSTPHALFMLETDGRYRIDADEDRDESRLTVFGGYAVMETSSGRVPVEPGRTVVVSGRGEYVFERALETGFDKWATVRDQQWQDSNSRRYVSSDMTGYEELDRYGSWNQDPDYGAVWYPTRVSSNWAPYRDGHWTYVRPWGWTWVDDAPWGYAPSHYGRWVQVRDRWGWVPGGVQERPVWAPALVGWIGGSALSVGVSGAAVSWYPLAPWERYDPWYRANPAYLTSVNRVVVDRQPRWSQGRGDEWRRWNRERATTVVNRDVFVNRRPVQNSFTRGNAEAIRQAPVVSGAQVAQQVLPQRNELLRYREANNVNVAAPTVMRQRPQASTPAQQQQPQQQQPQPQRQDVGQVVRPDFRRRGAPPVAVTPAPASQPQVSAPAPTPQAVQQPQQQPQNPAARGDRGQQLQQQEQAQRQQQEQAQRQQQQQQQQQEQAQRAGREQLQQRQQQEAAQRAAQEQQLQHQQQEAAQRGAQEQAQRAAQQQQAAQRAAQEQQQRAAQQQQQQQQAAQRAAQEQQQRAAQQQQQQQQAAQRGAQEQAQRAQQQQQQAQERARRESPQQQQPQPQAQPQPQPQEQANPAARGDRGNRDRAKEEKDKKDKEDKDKR